MEILSFFSAIWFASFLFGLFRLRFRLFLIRFWLRRLWFWFWLLYLLSWRSSVFLFWFLLNYFLLGFGTGFLVLLLFFRWFWCRFRFWLGFWFLLRFGFWTWFWFRFGFISRFLVLNLLFFHLHFLLFLFIRFGRLLL